MLPKPVIDAIGSGRTALLYPCESAEVLTEEMRDDIKLLIVPDGSWPQVKHMLKDGDGRLRHNRVRYVRLPESCKKSYYELFGIRKEPCVGHISTLEAVVEALRILAPKIETLHVLEKFESFLRDLKCKKEIDVELFSYTDRH